MNEEMSNLINRLKRYAMEYAIGNKVKIGIVGTGELMFAAAEMLEKLIAENSQLSSAWDDAVKTAQELKEECSALKNRVDTAIADIEFALSEGEMSCNRCAYFRAHAREEGLHPECKQEPSCHPKWRGISEEL